MSAHTVQLVVSPLGGIPGATAYHSSVLVDGREFSFSPLGICQANGPQTHEDATGRHSILGMGVSQRSGNQLLRTLAQHFKPGTYDFLRKNCNSFVDCALAYLVQKRLRPEYRTLEQFGAQIPSLITAVSGGQYTVNPKAISFDQTGLVRTLICQETSSIANGRVESIDSTDSSRALSAVMTKQETRDLSEVDELNDIKQRRPESSFANGTSLGSRAVPDRAPTLLPRHGFDGSFSGKSMMEIIEIDIAGDAELARQLQAEEDGLYVGEHLTDEQVARSLQNRESFREDAWSRTPSQTNAPRPLQDAIGINGGRDRLRGEPLEVREAAQDLQGGQSFMAGFGMAVSQFNEQLQNGFCAPGMPNRALVRV